MGTGDQVHAAVVLVLRAQRQPGVDQLVVRVRPVAHVAVPVGGAGVGRQLGHHAVVVTLAQHQLLVVEQAFAANARVIQVVDELLETLTSI